VLHHYLDHDLSGLSALDIGCSAGFIADDSLLKASKTIGVNIDDPGLERARERFGGASSS
jgi:ribosomal protein L11 methylase PrmA